jgi:hypothetical protein
VRGLSASGDQLRGYNLLLDGDVARGGLSAQLLGKELEIMGVLKILIGNRRVRGISSIAAIIIAVAVVLIFSSTIMWLLHFAVDTLWLVLKIGVLVLLVLIVAGWIKSSSKKVS